MLRSVSIKHGFILTMLFIVLLQTACAPLRVPRIDPSGQRVFAGDSTSFNCGLFNAQPAFQQPPPVDPCAQPGVQTLTPLPAPPVASTDPEALQLSPSRVVAPVGTEVVLVAGLNRRRHLHESGRPVNWVISRESVGYLTEVGNDRNFFDLVSNRRYGIQGPDYATSSTLLCDDTVDRGTELPGDDIRVLRGQTWSSVSSASPGVTRITALAPQVENWPARQQTATIYWVDAQWQFPAPVVVPATNRATLTTMVRRQTNQQAVSNWEVHYELLDGPEATFVVDGRQAGSRLVKSFTNSDGLATVELAPQTSQAGTAQVRVTIIQPNLDPESNAENLILGSTVTTVTWSAPQLSIGVNAPQVAEYGSQIVYNINVQNGGDVAAQNVVVSNVLPAGLTFESSVPAAQQMGNRLEWNIGSLEAQGFRQIALTCRVQQSGSIVNRVSVTGEPGLRGEAEATTQIQVDAIHLQLEGPDQVISGEDVPYRVTIRNTGDRPLVNVRLRDDFDEGLLHPGGASPIENNQLGTLQIGESREELIVFKTQRPGRFCHRLTISADGVAPKSSIACVSVNPPEPDPTYTLTLSAPAAQMEVGQPILFRATLFNNGPTTLTNVRVELRIDPNLRLLRRTVPAQDEPGKVIWVFNQIPPNRDAKLEVECVADRPVSQACCSVVATTDQNVTRNTETCLEITATTQPATEPPPVVNPNPNPNPVPNPGPAPGNNNVPGPNPNTNQPPPNNPNVPVRGQLKISLADLSDGVRSGDSVTYVLVVTNDSNAPDENVQINLQMTEGLSYVRLTGPVDPRVSRSPDGRSFAIQPIRFMRPGEEIRFEIELQSTSAGRQALRAQATSNRLQEPIFDVEETTIY